MVAYVLMGISISMTALINYCCSCYVEFIGVPAKLPQYIHHPYLVSYSAPFVQMAKVGVALTKGQTGAPPPFTAAPMDTDLTPAAIAAKDAAGQVSGAGTAVKASTSSSEEEHNWVEPKPSRAWWAEAMLSSPLATNRCAI